jgi:transcriptional regulator with XRE-family HTH domain
MSKDTKEPNDALEFDLGARLRSFRLAKGLSLATVAERTDISTSFLSLVESGQSDITWGRLARLLSLYDVEPNTLLDGATTADIVRRDKPPLSWRLGPGADAAFLAVRSNSPLSTAIGEFQPRGEQTELSTHPGEEFLYVCDGQVDVEFANGQQETLRKGDSLMFDAGIPHRLINRGTRKARVLSVAHSAWFDSSMHRLPRGRS